MNVATLRDRLADLIERMTVREAVTSSDDSISWHAHREAEQLEDASMIDELVAYLGQKRTSVQRSAAYFIIGKIGKNSQRRECTEHLLAYASREQDKYALSSLLDRLADLPKPEGLDITPVFTLLADKRWLVRHAAIQALRGSASPEAEDRVLEVLSKAPGPFDAVHCHVTLGAIGTAKSLPALAVGSASRKREVKQTASAATIAIEKRIANQ